MALPKIGEWLKVKVDQVVFEQVLPNTRLSMADGRGYWAFSCYVGESLEGVGSADTFTEAASMAHETVVAIEAGEIRKGIKTKKEGANG